MTTQYRCRVGVYVGAASFWWQPLESFCRSWNLSVSSEAECFPGCSGSWRQETGSWVCKPGYIGQMQHEGLREAEAAVLLFSFRSLLCSEKKTVSFVESVPKGRWAMCWAQSTDARAQSYFSFAHDFSVNVQQHGRRWGVAMPLLPTASCARPACRVSKALEPCF